MFNSLALLSDAAHMSPTPRRSPPPWRRSGSASAPADDERSFGYRRFEILAAAFNVVLLFAVAGYVLCESIFDPEPVGSLGMLGIAAIGLVVNLIAMRASAVGKDKSLNIKGAYLEARLSRAEDRRGRRPAGSWGLEPVPVPERRLSPGREPPFRRSNPSRRRGPCPCSRRRRPPRVRHRR